MVAFTDNLNLYFYHANQCANRWPQFDVSELVAECWLRNRGNLPLEHKNLTIRRDILDYINKETGFDRKKRRLNILYSDEVFDKPIESELGDLENREIIEKILSKSYLNRTEKLVLRLRLDNFSSEETGRIIGTSSSTVKSIFFKAKHKIREIEGAVK
jgi:DNA-directed RNA polymerase specialized sigma24 family protein